MPASLQPGSVIDGKYRVERLLGQGGMGVVVAVWHLHLEQTFALKLLHDEDPVLRQRLLREARAAGQLASEHATRVFDAGVLSTGEVFLVMELLDGRDLAAIIDDRGPLPLAEALDYVLQACEVLTEAHAQGIVHRDIKPPNLFLARRRDGTTVVKLLDFGIAKARVSSGQSPLTDTGALLGSPQYMAPEQLVSSRRVDHRADIWSLGVTLFELLGGGLPFDGPDVGAIYRHVLCDAPHPLRALRGDVPVDLERVVLRCLEKDPVDRHDSVAALAADLRRCLPGALASAPLSPFAQTQPGAAPTVPQLPLVLPAPAARSPGRKRIVAAGGIALGLMACASVGTWQWLRLDKRAPAVSASVQRARGRGPGSAAPSASAVPRPRIPHTSVKGLSGSAADALLEAQVRDDAQTLNAKAKSALDHKAYEEALQAASDALELIARYRDFGAERSSLAARASFQRGEALAYMTYAGAYVAEHDDASEQALEAAIAWDPTLAECSQHRLLTVRKRRIDNQRPKAEQTQLKQTLAKDAEAYLRSGELTSNCKDSVGEARGLLLPR